MNWLEPGQNPDISEKTPGQGPKKRTCPGKPGRMVSLAIYLLIKHMQDEIPSILWWEDEAVGPGPQVVTGGLCLREMHCLLNTWHGSITRALNSILLATSAKSPNDQSYSTRGSLNSLG